MQSGATWSQGRTCCFGSLCSQATTPALLLSGSLLASTHGTSSGRMPGGRLLLLLLLLRLWTLPPPLAGAGCGLLVCLLGRGRRLTLLDPLSHLLGCVLLALLAALLRQLIWRWPRPTGLLPRAHSQSLIEQVHDGGPIDVLRRLTPRVARACCLRVVLLLGSHMAGVT